MADEDFTVCSKLNEHCSYKWISGLLLTISPNYTRQRSKGKHTSLVAEKLVFSVESGCEICKKQRTKRWILCLWIQAIKSNYVSQWNGCTCWRICVKQRIKVHVNGSQLCICWCWNGVLVWLARQVTKLFATKRSMLVIAKHKTEKSERRNKHK